MDYLKAIERTKEKYSDEIKRLSELYLTEKLNELQKKYFKNHVLVLTDEYVVRIYAIRKEKLSLLINNTQGPLAACQVYQEIENKEHTDISEFHLRGYHVPKFTK